ncbi:MAG: hypothetical protein ACI4EQ_08945 [Lachnospiraceae bacterium]
MPKYRLNIKFTDKDLQTIYKANEKVVLVKHTAGNGDSQVAWVCFSPFMNNTIDWENQFAVYASNTEIQQGAEISKLSDLAATTKVVYEFEQAIFQKPALAAGLGDNTYAVKNKMSDYDGLTFGLAQDVQVNGVGIANNPINAVFVPYGQAISMTPIERIDVYLKNDINDGTVISHVTTIPLSVSYEENEVEHTIAYNSATGFYRES